MIRSVRMNDLWALQRKPRSSVMLYNEDMLVSPYRPRWFTLQRTLQGSSPAGAALVLDDQGIQALVHATPRRQRLELDIVMLAAYDTTGANTDPDMWFRLLETLCIQAGQHHVQRLYAGLSQRHDELREVFRQLGFRYYAQQSVMRLEGPDWDQGTSLAAMRPQSQRDIWSIHQLYGTLTPRPVQQAEAREARSWKLPLAQRWHRKQRHAWVLGQNDSLNAYVSLTSGPIAHVMNMLIRPETRELTTSVLRFALGQISDELPVYLLLRDYQNELMLPAGDLGFQPIGEQALLVKQTTVTVRRPILAPALEPVIEPRAPLPTISVLDEDRRSYVRSVRYDERY